MFSRYLVGLDGSSPSRAALRWATARATAERAPLVLLHVREPEAGLMDQAYARDESVAGAHLLSDEGDRLTGLGLDVQTQLLDGPVAWALGDAARPGDLLVIGTHKTGYLHGRVLGSRSVQVAMAAPCSVAVIPDIDLRFRRGVVVGVDEAADAPVVALAAADEAAARGEDLSLIRSLRGTAGDLRRSDALRAVRDAHPALAVRSRESQRGAAEALLDASRDKALLVVGPGTLDPRRSPIGSVLHDVLLNLNAPALVARAA